MAAAPVDEDVDAVPGGADGCTVATTAIAVAAVAAVDVGTRIEGPCMEEPEPGVWDASIGVGVPTRGVAVAVGIATAIAADTACVRQLSVTPPSIPAAVAGRVTSGTIVRTPPGVTARAVPPRLLMAPTRIATPRVTVSGTGTPTPL